MPAERAQIKASLVAKGFDEETKDRDHDFYFLRHNDLRRAIFTKLSRGRKYKTYDDGLLAAISKQLQLTRSQLNELIDCSMDGAQYIAALRNRGIIRDEPSS